MDAGSILIVDDESSIREVLSSILLDAGYRTLAAGTAEEGLELMNDAAISVAMIDLKLPGMSGIDLTNRRSGAPLEEEDMAFLYSLAGQAAVASDAMRPLHLGAHGGIGGRGIREPLLRHGIGITRGRC